MSGAGPGGGQAIKRFADPADIAGAVAFLTNDETAFITGQALPVDSMRYKIADRASATLAIIPLPSAISVVRDATATLDDASENLVCRK